MKYEPVIGLEVHAQMLTQTKLFCACSTTFGKEPNENTCPVCLGLPGVLPVLNKRVVDFAIRAALATGCQIAPRSIFARKNYFYPDLPKGYQISQYERPYCTNGSLEIEVEGVKKRISLQRIHMEEDAGKLLHEHPFTRSKSASWVDLNRAGVPLLEIVSEPEIRSPQEAVAYLRELRILLMYLDISDGNMEEGSIRCDANVSLRPVGEKKFGTRAEIKNMNSFRHLEKAILYEIERQSELLNHGGRVVQETRLWDAVSDATLSMRSKEEAHDYRYFPDPDLLPLEISQEWIEETRRSLPELPQAKRKRFENDYKLPLQDISLLIQSRSLAEFFEEGVKNYPQPKKVANWVLNEFLRMVKGDDEKIRNSPLKPQQVGLVFQKVDAGEISANMAKEILQKAFETGKNPEEIIRTEGLAQVSDTGELAKIIEAVFNENPKEVERYRAGDKKLLSFFIGQLMKKTKGKGNPSLASEILRKRLG